MKSLAKAFAAFVLVAAISSNVSAAPTPEQTAEEYFAALKKDGIKGVIPFLHPEEVTKLHSFIVALSREASAAGEDLPFLKEGETVKTLEKEKPEQSAIRFFEFISQAAPGLESALSGTSGRVLGHVVDADVAYVVAKMTVTMEGKKIESVDVIPLKKHNDGYKALMKAELMQVLEAMRERLKSKAK